MARDFEAHRDHLRAVAHRLLGDVDDAEDAVQETWIRLARNGSRDIDNLAAWLTTVVSRICLDMLRTRTARREDPTDRVGEIGDAAYDSDPEHEAVLIDSVGRALLVVLDTLNPDERVAFVLHDLFGIAFVDIASVLGRGAAATKKLASRARLRVRAADALPAAELAVQRAVVDAFLGAARDGDLHGLLKILAPDVVRTADPAALPAGMATVVRGAAAVAEETVLLRRRSGVAALALVDGAVGIVVAPRGRLLLALRVTVADGRITAYEVVADPIRLRGLDLAVLPDTD
ncbi:sigma-70 family RNA polymerase sigma factor [Nocardia thraciensis]